MASVSVLCCECTVVLALVCWVDVMLYWAGGGGNVFRMSICAAGFPSVAIAHHRYRPLRTRSVVNVACYYPYLALFYKICMYVC